MDSTGAVGNGRGCEVSLSRAIKFKYFPVENAIIFRPHICLFFLNELMISTIYVRSGGRFVVAV